MAPNVVPVPAGDDPVELLRRCEPVIRFSDLIEHGWTDCRGLALLPLVDGTAITPPRPPPWRPSGVVGNPAAEAAAYCQTCWYSAAFVVFVVVAEPALTPDTA